MCTQTVGLIAGELERAGIATAAIQLLRDVALRVRPPRGLWVPYRHGYPLGEPSRPEVQHRVLEAALRMLEDTAVQTPVLADFVPEATPVLA